MELNFGERLRVWRARSGLSSREAVAALRELLPQVWWISHEKLRRMEIGEINELEVNPLVLAALAQIYSCNVSDLSFSALEDARRLRDLLDANSCWNDVLAVPA